MSHALLSAPRTSAPDLPRRIAVTVAGAICLLVGERVGLPLVDDEAFRSAVAGTGPLAVLSPLALGLNPFVSAFLLVELVALVHPRLRPLRRGSARERLGLTRAAWIVAVAFAAMQGWGVAVYFQSTQDPYGYPLLAGGGGAAAVVAATLVAGTVALGCAAVVVSRHGVGNGFAVLLAVTAAETALWFVRDVLRQPRAAWSDAALLVALALVVIVPLVLAHGRREDAPGPRLPVPTCGLAVIQAPSVLLSLAAALAAWLPSMGTVASALREESWLGAFVDLAVVAALAILLARLFCPPEGVVAAFRRAVPPEADPGPAVRRALRSANVRSVALVVAVLLVPMAAARVGVPVGIPSEVLLALAIVAAVALDLRAELDARARVPALVSARSFHRVYAVEPALDALGEAGIFAFARAARYRRLFHFFAPWAPVEVLVPPERAADAEAICAHVDGGEVRSKP